MTDLFTSRSCVFSPCRVYRYRLDIRWEEGPLCNFIMLNPSTADEIANDPTVERCERRARKWGYAGLIVTNLFAFRATNPCVMKAAADPVGPENDRHIFNAAYDAGMVLCGWGNHGCHGGRSKAVREMLREARIECFALTTCANGEPGHPLYVSYDVKPKLMAGERPW